MVAICYVEVWVSIVLQALILLKLARNSLFKPYYGFALLLAVGLIRDTLLVLLKYNSSSYDKAWEITLPFYLGAQILAGITAYFRLASYYGGMGRFAGWLYLFSVMFGWFICFVVGHQVDDFREYPRLAGICLLAERSAAIILTSATVLVLAFLSRFPSPRMQMPSNLLWHLRLLTGMFTLIAISQAFFSSSFANENAVLSGETIFFLAGNAVYVIWLLHLTPAGELAVSWPAIDLNVRASVDTLNNELLRTAGRISPRASISND